METMKVYPSWLTSGSRKISASVKAYSWLPIIYLNPELFWQGPEFPLYIPYTQTCLPKESIDKLDQSAHGVQLKLTLLQDAKVDVSSCQSDLAKTQVSSRWFWAFFSTTSGRYWSNMKVLISSGRLKASIRVGTTESTSKRKNQVKEASFSWDIGNV